jgi:hypothetical protein
VLEPYFFDHDALVQVGLEHRDSFRVARPFPHAHFDGLLPDAVVQAALDEFPSPRERKDWTRADRTDAIKLSMPHDWTLGPDTRHLLNQFNSASFIDFLEALTGISGLLPDPHYFGGGLHQIEQGGFLKIHADFNKHQRLHLDRRLNAILYLNHDWNESWGGHLELWDRSMTERVVSLAPVFNRLVVFETTDTSFHGHPDPLQCPAGVCRRSLALYYYSNGRPAAEVSAPHSTLHQVRPGEDFDPAPPVPPRPAAWYRRREFWRDCVPPVALKAKRRASRLARSYRSG